MPLDDKLRRQWKAVGYERGHGSDAVLPPAPSGFRRLYYLTSTEHAVSNVVFSRIKVSRFSQLNDPFELLGQNFGDRAIRKTVRDHRANFDLSNGLVCFSEDWVDPVLWSHYALQHRGIALGFDVREEQVQPVNYSSQRLKEKRRSTARKIDNQLAELLTFTKFESWRYEREWRMLLELKKCDQEGGLFFVPMSPKLVLREVILGATCEMNLKRMREMVRKHHPDAITYQARLALRSFRIIPKGSTVP